MIVNINYQSAFLTYMVTPVSPTTLYSDMAKKERDNQANMLTEFTGAISDVLGQNKIIN